MSRDMIIIEDFRPDFDIDMIMAKLPESIDRERVEELASQAGEICRARAGAVLAAVESQSEDETRVGGVTLKSALLNEKMGDLGRVFPYISSEGEELARWGAQFSDANDRLIIHQLRQVAVKSGERELEKRLGERYGIPVLSSMNPGSLKTWPIKEQENLFAILEPLPAGFGVRLEPSMRISPDYSITGIFFQTGEKFYNCQLCPNDGCPNRKAPREI